MSRIVTFLKCEKCETEYKDIYISFGHLDEDVYWQWQCNRYVVDTENVGYVNELLVKALPGYGCPGVEGPEEDAP